MAADNRHAEGGRGVPQPGQDRIARLGIAGPDGIDDGNGAPAHGGDIGDVHHDATPASEPGVLLDEGADETLDRQEKETVAIRDGPRSHRRRRSRTRRKGRGARRRRRYRLSPRTRGWRASSPRCRRGRPTPASGGALQKRGEARLGVRDRRVVVEVGSHVMMRAAMQIDTVERFPMQALETAAHCGFAHGRRRRGRRGHGRSRRRA